MSWDYASAAHPCGHEQVLERYVLDQFDFRTLHYAAAPSLNMRAPINGAARVQMWLKGVLCPSDDPNYGYSIVPDTDRVEAGYTFSKIVFNKPVRLIRPLIEVSYITRPGFCLQCNGQTQINDWQITASGGLAHAEGVNKLSQQCLKYILTSRNPANPNVVCTLKNSLNHKIVSGSSQAQATSVTAALQNYQAIQTAQKAVQPLSPGEVLRDIRSVSVTQDTDNPLLSYLSVVVTAYGVAKPVALNVALQTPSPTS